MTRSQQSLHFVKKIRILDLLKIRFTGSDIVHLTMR